MYSHFCRNLKNYFSICENGDPDEYRLEIAQVLRGIEDRELYNRWKVNNKEMYEELNNLIYEIAENADDRGRFFGFETLTRDLWGLEFVAAKSDTYSKSRERIEEQLKLIALLLGCQYCP